MIKASNEEEAREEKQVVKLNNFLTESETEIWTGGCIARAAQQLF